MEGLCICALFVCTAGTAATIGANRSTGSNARAQLEAPSRRCAHLHAAVPSPSSPRWAYPPTPPGHRLPGRQ